MKIAIVNSVAGISSKELAVRLREDKHRVDVFKPFKDGRWLLEDYDVVFNYGYGGDLRAKKVINPVPAVNRCVDKVSSFEAFNRAKVDTVAYTTEHAKIPKDWELVVVRKEVNGRKAEDFDYFENKPGKVPHGRLYSEYFFHRYEYRVVVFMNKVVGVYYKNRDKNDVWHFNVQPMKGFTKMGAQCIRAAKALGIDYVGFDVIANNKNTFKILEANSAPILTQEAMDAIANHFNK
jgi:glutathione synthase/RimK-type ligase-like ATP-grasp enzyme